MRKVLIALLSVLFLATVAFAQTEILVNGDFETWTDANTPTGWTKAENVTQESTEIHGGTYSAMHVGGTKDIAQRIPVTAGKSYTISIWYKVVENDGSDARIWSYWLNGDTYLDDNLNELRGPNNSYLDNNGGVWTQYTVTLDAPATADSLLFEVRTYSGATTYWDDLSVVENAAAPEDPYDYFIPKGSHEKGWATLAEAVDSINANGVVGEINLILDADTLREQSFTFTADFDETNNVTVKPAEGRNVVLLVEGGASQGNGDQMIGFDKGYVTFDGSNDGSDSRNLIVSTEDTAGVGIDVPFGLNTTDADNIVIKNLIIKNLDNGASDFKYGVVVNDVGGNSLTVDNCQIGSTTHPAWRQGIVFWGDWTNGGVTGVFTNNEIHAGCMGIEAYLGNECKINNNTIYIHPSANIGTYTYAYGIDLSWVKSTEVMNNTVYGLEKTTTATKIIGISTASHPSGAEFIVANNMVVVGAADETSPVYAFGMRSSNNMGSFKLYNNTFVVNDNSGTAVAHGIGQAIGDGTISIDLKDNIIVNNHTANTASSAIAMNGANHTLVSDNNVMVSDQNFVSYHGTDYADLAAWQAAGQDAGSVSKAVTFVGATDLHLAAPSDTDLDLVMPNVGVYTDIDGDARDMFYAYAGADEGSAYPASNDLNLTFDTDADVANWSHWTSTNGYTVEAWGADSVLVLSDGGYGMSDERAVKATPGSVYKLSIDIKTSLWEGASNNLDLSVQGLGNDDITVSCISDSAWTTFTLMGIAEAADGYIRIEGYKAGTVDTVFVDNVVWDDQYMDVIPSASIADAQNVPDGNDVACIGVVTATTIGSPQFMQDADAGISLFDSGLLGKLEEGDEVLVVGERASYNGLIEVKYPIEYQVLSTGNVIEPMLVTVPELVDYHGMLVMVEDVDTVAGFSWPTYSSTQTLTDGTNEFAMRIDSDGEMVDSDPPASWPLDLIGVVGWYNGPQVMPRYMADFITNQAPNPFMILNPADSAVITSLEAPELEKIDMDGDSVYAVFINWTDADDPEGDSLFYEMNFIGEGGPDETPTSIDTFMYIPIDEEPYNMNGTYTYYFTATDPMGEMAYSDTQTITFDFPAPPMIVDAQVVLVDGTPKYFVEFDLPLTTAATTNFMVIDTDDGGAETAPTAVEMVGDKAVMLTVALTEDHNTNLVTSGLTAVGQTVTKADTAWGNRVYIPFSDNHLEDAAGILEDFEDSTLTLFDKAPTYSGSTNGILDASALAVSDEEAYEGLMSGKFTILDDPAKSGGWFVRHYIKYPYEKTVQSSSTLFLMVKGTGNIDMAMTVKDDQGSSPGYCRTMWKHVTLSADDWQVLSFDLKNDPVEKWITGDGVIEGGLVTLCDLHIMSSEDEDAVIYLDGFTEREKLSPVNITLSVMMHEWLRLGKFNLAMDYVDVAGTFNGWDGSSTIATDYDSDTTYSVTIPMMPYSTQNFKFRINGSWDNDKHEFPNDGPSRELLVPAGAKEFTYWFNDDTLQTAIDGVPTEFALHQNYPNPFNPTTTINFDLPEASDVKLVIYDITGRKVRTLVNNNSIEAGYKKIVWNGRDDFGNGVATGMYIYRLIAGDFVDVKKMTFLK